MNIPTSSSARVRCGGEFNLAIFFSFNCLRYARALAISRAGHWAFGYDPLLRVIWLGREGAFRKKVVDLAGLKLGESVWMWAVGLEPSQSLPSSGSARRAECAGLTTRRR